MRLIWIVAVAAACGKGGGVRASGGLDTAKIENVVVAFDGAHDARIEMTLLGSDGKPLQFVNANIGPSVELELRDGADRLCKASYHISNKEQDPKTGRIVSKTYLDAEEGFCLETLVKKGYAGTPEVVLHLAENGRTLDYKQKLAAFVVPDSRPKKVPELDAEIAAMKKLVAEIDPVVVLPPCTPALAGDKPLEAVDQPLVMDKPPPGSDAGWVWLRSPLFFAIEAYDKREYEKVDELKARVAAARKLIVFVARKHTAPQRHPDKTFDGGIFDGWIDILDRDQGKAICAIELKATSSEVIDFKAKVTKNKRTDEVVSAEDDANQKMVADFQRNVGVAITAAMDKAGVGAARPVLREIPALEKP